MSSEPNDRFYHTDDCDFTKRQGGTNILRIFRGGNGDWYVGVHPSDEMGINCFVRVTTSGSRNPAVAAQVAALWRVMEEWSVEKLAP